MNIISRLFSSRGHANEADRVKREAQELIAEHGKEAIGIVLRMINAGQGKSSHGENQHLWSLFREVNAQLGVNSDSPPLGVS